MAWWVLGAAACKCICTYKGTRSVAAVDCYGYNCIAINPGCWRRHASSSGLVQRLLWSMLGCMRHPPCREMHGHAWACMGMLATMLGRGVMTVACATSHARCKHVRTFTGLWAHTQVTNAALKWTAPLRWPHYDGHTTGLTRRHTTRSSHLHNSRLGLIRGALLPALPLGRWLGSRAL